MTRRECAAPIIAAVLARVGRADLKALRRALREAYPFGVRRHWPYKAWLAEVHRQVGQYGGPAPRDTRTLGLFD